MVSTFRIRASLAALATLALGLWIRFTPAAPEWLRDSAGGAAYVILCTLLAAFIAPHASALRLAASAWLFTCAVECLQAWHPYWLDAARHTLPGRLVLGTTFAWHDFAPYTAGALIGYVALQFLERPLYKPRTQ